jgi:hypothetical protein
MPSKNEHLGKAVSNKKFAEAIKSSSPTYVGWAMTALFYSALHYVEAYNAKFNTRFTNHQDRNADIKDNPVFAPIRDDYLDLCNLSYNARYEAVNYGAEKLKEAQEYQAAVERHITGMI